MNDFGRNPLYIVSLLGHARRCGLKKTANELRKFQDQELLLTIENNIRGGLSSAMVARHF